MLLRLNIVRGRPIRLLRFPSVFIIGRDFLSIEATISFVVVLPQLPLIAISGTGCCSLQYSARSPRALSVSTTSIIQNCEPQPLISDDTTAPAAHLLNTSLTNLLPSNRGPFKAKKSSPLFTVRESVETPLIKPSLPPLVRRPFTAFKTSFILSLTI